MSYRALIRFHRFAIAAFALAIAVSIAPASAAEFKPERDLTVINVSSPGGGSDVCIRAMMKVLNDLKLCPVNWIVDYRVGGSGAKGYTYVARKTGDEYLMTKIASSFFTTPLLGESPVSYKDFTPVASMVEDPYIMIVKADSDIKSVADIKKRGYILSGTTAIAADPALIAQQLKNAMGIELDILPHGGAGEVLSALLGGHIDVMFSNPPECLRLVEAGEVRPLAVTSGSRLNILPDVPTLQETGYDVVVTQFRAFVMPKGASPEAVEFWAGIIEKIVTSANWKEEYLDRYATLPKFLTGDALAAEMESRNAMYAEFMDSLGLTKKK